MHKVICLEVFGTVIGRFVEVSLVLLGFALIIDALVVNPFVSVTEVFGIHNAMAPFAGGYRILGLDEIIAGRFPEFFAFFGFRRETAKGFLDKVLREAETTVTGIIEDFVGHVGNDGCVLEFWTISLLIPLSSP